MCIKEIKEKKIFFYIRYMDKWKKGHKSPRNEYRLFAFFKKTSCHKSKISITEIIVALIKLDYLLKN